MGRYYCYSLGEGILSFVDLIHLTIGGLNEQKKGGLIMLLFKKNYVQLGGKRVEVPKLTRIKLKKLDMHIGSIGDYLVKLFLIPVEERSHFIVAGINVTVDEIYELTSLLSEIPMEYLDEHASISECTEFLKLTWEFNDMEKALKNMNSLLPPMAEQFVKSIVMGMEKGTAE